MVDELTTPEESQGHVEQTPTFLEYLETPQGHEIAKRIVGVVEGLQQATLTSNAEQAKLNLQYGHRRGIWMLVVHTIVLCIVLGATAFLSYNEKLDSTTALLLDTLAGYFFGRRPS